MMRIDWVAKLTSRKFWVAITSFVTMLIIALGGTESQANQTAALIMAAASACAYVIGEGLTDAAAAQPNPIVFNGNDEYEPPDEDEDDLK